MHGVHVDRVQFPAARMKKVILILIILTVVLGIFFIFSKKEIYQKPVIEPNIIVDSPKPGTVISGPFAISGKAKGFYFEATFPVKLIDSQNNVIAAGYAKATSDWMTADYVPFETGEINFLLYPSATTSGFVVFSKDNPSGLPEKDEEFRVAVIISPIETIKVKAYFNNSNLDPQISCNKVFPIEREVIKTSAVAKAALEELLKGPTEAETNQGFITSINPGVKIQSLNIDNGVAKVDFDEQLQNAVGGSCRVSAIRSQIIETLKQFPSIKNVIISINGETEEILQP